MARSIRLPGALLSFALCAHAGAQSPAPSIAPDTAPASGSSRVFIYPKTGQTEEQQSRDRYECYTWANSQSGFDPSAPGGGVPSAESAARRENYQRAMAACLEARGYSVSFPAQTTSPAPPVTPPPTPAPYSRPAFIEHYAAPAPPELKYHPFAVQIDGGYDITSGATRDNLDNGANVGLGLSWFPTSALPIGLRIDGSYNRFRAREGLLNAGGAGYTSGHENIYGGDADLQLDLAHRSGRSKLYLFGGAGRYREQTDLRQVSLIEGPVCPFFRCGPDGYSVATTAQRTTSGWHNAWNAGIGWETAVADRGSFFIEARFLRILPNSDKTQFIPIRLGFRF